MNEQQALWYPPQQPGFGPWVERTSAIGKCQAPNGSRILWLTSDERLRRRFSKQECNAEDRAWSTFVVAYCIRLEDKPAAAKATKNASIPADYIAWDGKTPHPNLPAGTSIRYMLRGGAVGSSQLHGVAWGHTGGPGDVIAYRPLHDGDLKMLLRDSAEHKPRHIATPPFDHAAIVAAGRTYARRAHDERVSAAARVESPRDHRLGRFN